MNLEIVEKNIKYQEDINKIANILKRYKNENIYSNEEDLDSFSNESKEPDLTEDEIEVLFEKAEKIFQFFNSYEEAKNAMNFLYINNPELSKEFFETL